jgi:FtsH-binding integral membrane protein
VRVLCAQFMFSIWWGLLVVLVISLVWLVVMIVVSVTAVAARAQGAPPSTLTPLYCLYGFCGVLLFSAYLVIDTQLLLGGCRGIAISPEDYIYASLQLYLDLVNIFIYLLMILGSAKK